MASWTKIGLAAVGACLCAALGVVGAVVYMTPVTPSAVATPERSLDFPVGEAEFDDPRPVELRLSRGDDLALTAPASGRVTTSHCKVGVPMESGKAALTVDGAPLVGLATSVPLWRDLSIGDEGEDVTALQTELARLGYQVDAEGPLRRAALRALRDLYEQAGEKTGALDRVPIDRIVWLPAPSTSVNECLATVGSTVSAGDPVASVPGDLESVAVAEPPEGLVPGGRVLVVDGTSVSVDAALAVSDPAALVQLSPLPSLQPTSNDGDAGRAGAPTAQLVLAAPQTVSVVPPSALFGAADGRGCVLSDGAVRTVGIAGSQLGQTFVVVDGPVPLTTVDTDPAPGTPCT
ncbi:peptidoglycan-binding domain-containing protein [Cellulosimicrobium protaetiae]|uniref:Peptidoglycan-binding protein n=1 Tax=Cellulosimicrobium protaetiae TaxID=2587808 RepID=A0A6M5UKE3_9MICO|nr:peptidoglycan-binding protein [Cellulosimicrobium protaetiae]QJW37588.1 peptidoglycan-binding protein [Cellulosimicrobium protaetiae]